MFRWLRSGNPYHIIFLLVYAIVIKYYYLIHPLAPVLDPHSDGGLYPYILQKLQELHFGAGAFALLAFILLFIQAVLLNSIINRFKLLPGSGYFPAYCFLLFTSFSAQWNVFSAPLLANVVLLAMLPQLFDLYTTQRPRSRAFSLGFLAGFASLLYTPVLILILLIWIALLVSRPFRLAEWILVLMGLLCPYYFLGTILFLLDKLTLSHIIAFPLLSYPHLLSHPWLLGGIIWCIIWFLYGNFKMQQAHMKMLIHVRKCWLILLAFSLVALTLPFLPGTFSLTGWLVALLPMCGFTAMALWHVNKTWFTLLIHLSALVYIFLIQWVY